MATEQTHIDYLIARYLSNEASDEERARVESWCCESPDNQQYFDGFRQIIDASQTIVPDPRFNVDAAWMRIQPQIHTAKIRRLNTVWWAAAASVALIVGIWWSMQKPSTPTEMVIAAVGKAQRSLLPDSSSVEVDPRSSVTYAKGFGKTNRDISLKGNATFDVRHQPGPPFIVHVQEALVRDIGTTFYVNTLSDTNRVEVYVKAGSVAFYTASNEGIILKQGQTGYYDKRTKVFSLKEVAESPTVDSIKVRSFAFNETSLGDVVSLLQKSFGTKIDLENPKLSDCTITVTFKNENIDTIIDIVAETLNLKVTRTRSGYLLKGQECTKN